MMAALSHVDAEVKLTVYNVEAVVGTVEIPLKAETREFDGAILPVKLTVDMDGFKRNLAEALRELAMEIDSDDWSGL